MRLVLRDYIEALLLTGKRHGDEAMELNWNRFEWREHERKKYLRAWVAGITWGRVYARQARAVAAFERKAVRQRDVSGLSLGELLNCG